MSARNSGKHVKKEKHLSTGKKILLAFLSIILIAVLAVGIYGYSLLSRLNQTDISKPSEKDPNMVAVEETEQKNRNVINIALFGLDRRSTTGNSRSDTIMVATIDKDNKKIKLTSLMRDMYVSIPGKHDNRINAAYAMGGPGLAINTINQNFDLDIKYYATIDFTGLAKLIDKLGGVDINIKEGEIQYANNYIDELNQIDKSYQAEHITKSGMQHLNGKQAVAYMRIRYYGNGDYERTERQRTVLTKIFDKAKAGGVLKFPGLVSTVLPYVETNMPKTEIVSLGVSALGFAADIEQYRLPVDKTYKSQKIDGMAVLVPDIEKNTELLHEFIYGEAKAVDKTK